MKKEFILLIAIMLFTSCGGVQKMFQVFTVASNDVNYSQDEFVYEDSICVITYNLWADKGRMAFSLFNKTDKMLYVDMSNSHFVMNNHAMDYFMDKTERYSMQYTTSTTGTAHEFRDYMLLKSSYSPYFNPYFNTLGVSASTTAGYNMATETEYKEKIIIAIPPYTYKVFCDYMLIDCYFVEGGKSLWNFSIEESPITYRNSLTMYVGDKINIHTVDNSFYVCKIENFSQIYALKSLNRSKLDNYTDYELIKNNPNSNWVKIKIDRKKSNRYYVVYAE